MFGSSKLEEHIEFKNSLGNAVPRKILISVSYLVCRTIYCQC